MIRKTLLSTACRSTIRNQYAVQVRRQHSDNVVHGVKNYSVNPGQFHPIPEKRPEFNWEDPLSLDSMLTDEEIQIRDMVLYSSHKKIYIYFFNIKKKVYVTRLSV